MMTVARSRLNDWKTKQNNEHLFLNLSYSLQQHRVREDFFFLGTAFTSDDPVWLIWNRRRLILALATFEHTEFWTVDFVFALLDGCFSDIIERLASDTQRLVRTCKQSRKMGGSVSTIPMSRTKRLRTAPATHTCTYNIYIFYSLCLICAYEACSTYYALMKAWYTVRNLLCDKLIYRILYICYI